MEPTEENIRAWEEAHRGRPPVREPGLPRIVRRALGELAKRRVLHLFCGTGTATAELAGLGAVTTGVDPSAAALETARRRESSVVWVDGDPSSLPQQLRRGRFDLVYTGPGALEQVRDLDGWAQGMAAAARAGGDVLVFDEHPIARCVDPLLHWRESYFDGVRLGEIVTSLARAGLATHAVEEYPAQAGGARRLDARVPGWFLLYARRG